MKLEIQLSLILLMSILMTACATESFQKPCDEHTLFCGSKTKINQW